MNELPNYYTTLFNAVTNAIKALERQDFGTAQNLLVRGQQDSEDLYVTGGNPDARVGSLPCS